MSKPEVRAVFPYIILLLAMSTVSFLFGVFYQNSKETNHKIQIIHQDSIPNFEEEFQNF
jgi:hypothetical protein